MWFDIQQVEVLKRRNKRNDPCVPNELNFDQMILDDYLEQLGCKAPYHKTGDSMEICDSTENMTKASFDFVWNQKVKKACTSASMITYNYIEEEINESESFYVSFIYPNQYKEVVMVRAVDLQILVGNAGGYIGLFCGNVIFDFILIDYLFKCQLNI